MGTTFWKTDAIINIGKAVAVAVSISTGTAAGAAAALEIACVYISSGVMSGTEK